MPVKKKTSQTIIKKDEENDEVYVAPQKPIEELKLSTERRVVQISPIEALLSKTMYAGSSNPQSLTYYIKSNVVDEETKRETIMFVEQNVKYPPALLKMIDEIIANAMDHLTHYPLLTSYIEVTFDKASGIISVKNDGPGIIVEERQNTRGEKLSSIELIVAETLTGDNVRETRNIRQGAHGQGACISAAYSQWFIMETVDSKSKLHYTQKFYPSKDALNNIIIGYDKPDVKTATPEQLSHTYTRVTFCPDYKLRFHDYKDFDTLSKLIETRSYQAAAFTGKLVTYNDQKIKITYTDFCNMHCISDLFNFKMKSTIVPYPWDVCVSLSSGKFISYSLVNGAYVSGGGSFMTHIQNVILETIKPKLELELKKNKITYNRNTVLNQLFIMMKGSIISPQYQSQTKEIIADPIEKFATYTIGPTDATNLWKFLQEPIMQAFKGKQITKTKITRGEINVKKYLDAGLAGKKTKETRILFIAEGDSAFSIVKVGMDKCLDFEHFGIFSIQGVPMNALKESKDLGHHKYRAGHKLLANERLMSLMKVIGLDFTKKYDQTPEGDHEFSMLRYSACCATVDQDEDGKGNIFGLIMTFFMTFWPSLIKRCFLMRLNTPVIRAFPKTIGAGKNKRCVEEFYSEPEYFKWVKEKFEGNESNLKATYNVKYYKGLGTHSETKSRPEITQIFKKFADIVVKYHMDPNALRNLVVYFGEDSDLRKEVLREPNTKVPTEGQDIDVSEQFQIDTDSYQRDNLQRKLPHENDGMVQSRRKVFFIARKYVSSKNEIKVAGLAGKCVSDANYHHGEASLESTITRMGIESPVIRQFPLLRPFGNFGTLDKGFKNFAASRYITTYLNNRLAFGLCPKADDYILPYKLYDGERYEPEYYLPIVPLSILEHYSVPATGWAVTMWARDWNSVLTATREAIKTNKPELVTKKPFPMTKRGFNGTFRVVNGKLYSVGVYKYVAAENTIYVSELPHGVYSEQWLIGDGDADKPKGVSALEYVKSYKDYTSSIVNIKIELEPDSLKTIQEKFGDANFDAIEKYFKLYEVINDNINMISAENTVKEYKNYEDVFVTWFKARSAMYVVRIQREIILKTLQIKMLNNMIKFAANMKKYGISSDTTIEQIIDILKREKYDIINHTLLNNPLYTDVKDLENKIINEPWASYDYILNMNSRDVSEQENTKRMQKVIQLMRDIVELKTTDNMQPGAKIWLKELDELEETVRLGFTVGWSYGDDEVLFKDDGDDSNKALLESGKVKEKKSNKIKTIAPKRGTEDE